MNDYHPCLTNSPDKFFSLLGLWDVCRQDAVSMRNSVVGVGSSTPGFCQSHLGHAHGQHRAGWDMWGSHPALCVCSRHKILTGILEYPCQGKQLQSSQKEQKCSSAADGTVWKSWVNRSRKWFTVFSQFYLSCPEYSKAPLHTLGNSSNWGVEVFHFVPLKAA